MTSEQLEKIFLPFEQVGSQVRKTEGTGLGLAITQKMVSLMSSTIEVQSQLGKGSIFWFDLELPTAPNWSEAAKTHPQGTIIGFTSKQRKILVVDDQWENRSVVVNLLEPIGFAMIEASNGQEGLDKAAEFQPDLIITDLLMPIMDGFEMIQHLRQSSDVNAICNFVQNVEPTGGGDAPECYELVLHEAQSLSWSNSASKSLVLIGDDLPHPPAHNPKKLNWRQEADKLADQEIMVYGVQALNRSHATPFYKELAEKSGGFHVNLDQFSYITDLFLAVCYQQSSNEQLQAYEQEVIDQGRMSRGLNQIFNSMMKREETSYYASADLRAVSPGRFQVLEVEQDISIKAFVLENGLTFKVGRGFYEFTKTETIQGHKEIILMERTTGDLFEGESAREMLGLPVGATVRIKPSNLEKYVVFVQSTSANRKLIGSTRFLYEVEDWSR